MLHVRVCGLNKKNMTEPGDFAICDITQIYFNIYKTNNTKQIYSC